MKMDAFDWVMLITLATVWGGSFLFNAILVAELPVITIVAIRVTVAALALWGFVRVTGRKIPTSPQVWGALLILGVLNNAIPFSCISWARRPFKAHKARAGRDRDALGITNSVTGQRIALYNPRSDAADVDRELHETSAVSDRN